jgi:hypothetical protein
LEYPINEAELGMDERYMNAHSDLAMKSDEVLQVELEVLRTEHRDLDASIQALEETGADQLTVQRVKKRKLALKDRIAAIEDRLTPDIIA